MEIPVGTDPRFEARTRTLLRQVTLVTLDADIAERAIVLPRTHRIKLLGAMIWGSVQVHGPILVARNTKDFP